VKNRLRDLKNEILVVCYGGSWEKGHQQGSGCARVVGRAGQALDPAGCCQTAGARCLPLPPLPAFT